MHPQGITDTAVGTSEREFDILQDFWPTAHAPQLQVQQQERHNRAVNFKHSWCTVETAAAGSSHQLQGFHSLFDNAHHVGMLILGVAG
jgi:hypothetical protein